MVRGGRILAGAALIAGLGGCHVLFGHAAPSGADGQPGDERRPRLDGLSGERRAGDLVTGEALPTDGRVRDGGFAGEAIVLDTGLPCDPKMDWCPEIADTQKTLRGVWATSDAKTAYAVGDDVVLLRQGGGSWAVAPITSALPAATWRGVHMISDDAWLVGNLLTGAAAAFHLHFSSTTTLKALPISTVSVSTQTLNAIWMTSQTEGLVAAAATSGGGVIDQVQSAGISSVETTATPCTSVSRAGVHAWIAVSNLEVRYHNSTSSPSWQNQDLTGVPASTVIEAVVALDAPNLGFMCGCGQTPMAGVVFCCKAGEGCAATTIPGVKLHGIAATSKPNQATYWVVGEKSLDGVIYTGTATLNPRKLYAPTLNLLATSPLRGVWASPASPGDVFAVGDDGTVLHHQDP